MRDVLIHDYIGVDIDEVWNVASSRIPELAVMLGAAPAVIPVAAAGSTQQRTSSRGTVA